MFRVIFPSADFPLIERNVHAFVGRQRRKELCVIDDLCNTLKAHHDGSVDFVLVNLLPSYVVTLTKNGVAATTSPTRVNSSRIAEGAGARFGS